VKSARLFLTGIFPFLIPNAVMAAVVPLLPFGTILLGTAYAVCRAKLPSARRSRRLLKFVLFVYFSVLYLMLFFIFRFAFYYYIPLLTVAAVAVVSIVLSKKMLPETAAGVLLNLATLLAFVMMLPPRFTPGLAHRLEHEKYVRPIYLFMGTLERPDREKYDAYAGVRSIVADPKEKSIYFTAKGGRRAGFFSLHRIDASAPGREERISRSRIFDAALTPDGSKLLATDYENARLLVLDPETLETIKSLPTNPYPMFIVVDRFYHRAFVTHEGVGAIIEYSLPDIRRKRKKLTFSAPIAVAVDWDSGEFYCANWMFPFMFSELDMLSLSASRVKFPFAPVGSGVALDARRYRVYVADGLSGRVYAVDRDSFRTVGTIRALPGVRPIAVDGKRRLIYVGNMMEPYLRVYSYDHRLLAKIYIGRNCRAIYLTPATNRLLVGTSLGVLEVDVDRMINHIFRRNRKDRKL
jgi:DNA-binding beta-propeller fold protein YncE